MSTQMVCAKTAKPGYLDRDGTSAANRSKCLVSAVHRLRPRPAGRNSFTLLELLVVLAITAILVSLLLPALSRSKAAAQSVACKGNLRQFGMAMQLYLSDFNACPYFYKEPRFWCDSLLPYVGNNWTNRLYRCPSYRGRLSPPQPVNQGVIAPFGSYGINHRGLGYEGADGIGRPLGVCSFEVHKMVRGQDIAVPSDMMAIGDAYVSNGTNIVSGFGIMDINFTTLPTPDESQAAAQRHRGRLNLVYCDAHVDALPWRPLLLKPTDTILQQWNNDHRPHRELLRR